jgi:alkyl sulfatase BDS1-like metallo-beta-lactamase superfamily hydrolase
VQAVFSTISADTVLAMPIDILFDFAAVHVVGPAAAKAHVPIDFAFTDPEETSTMWVGRGVLNARKDGFDPNFAIVVP